MDQHVPSADGPHVPMFQQDKSGQMSMDEFNWAYATLQQEVEDCHWSKMEAQVAIPPVMLVAV